MEKDLLSKFYITIPRMKSYRAKREALKMLRGSVEEHHAMLGAYLTQLRIVNRPSLFNIMCDRAHISAPPVFRRLYIGYDALRKYLHGCRPIIEFDGCFLKTFLGGQLLSTAGRDGNDQMFPILWVVVEGENYDSWSWFLGLLFDDLLIMGMVGRLLVINRRSLNMPLKTEFLLLSTEIGKRSIIAML
ncbi:hypothetical protein Cni_G02129 [Canna indica]|uniref:MULE transposase domain-containing protein n=1 Tax=Canna indica TaxID=4628 RepID=A0AAQ3JPI7_9LILI|nr:hypothetical protein Cni_G02129 [Canna indica]